MTAMPPLRYITHDTPLRVAGAAEYDYFEGCEERFTRFSNYGDTYSLYKVTGEGANRRLLLPRAVCPASPVDKRSHGIPCDFRLRDFEARNDQQREILSTVLPLVEAGESFLVEAGTGVGKTVLAQVMIAARKTTTLIVVDQENIKTQWLKAIERFLGIPREQVGIIQADSCEYNGYRICIAMLHSISKEDRYPQAMYDYFGLVVFDECHVLAADLFSNVCWVLSAAQRIGLSATIDRRDGREAVFKSHIGPVAIRSSATPLVPKVIMVETGWKVPRVTRRVKGVFKTIPLPHKPGRTMGLYGAQAEDRRRNGIIAGLAKQAYEVGRNIVIFSDLRDNHLPRIAEVLQFEGIPKSDIGYYVGGMEEDELDEAAAKRIVLTTYKMTSKAVDKPWWDTAILCTARSDVRQILGRILREYPGKRCALSGGEGEGLVPLVFDLVDSDSWVLDGYAKARERYYIGINAPLLKRRAA